MTALPFFRALTMPFEPDAPPGSDDEPAALPGSDDEPAVVPGSDDEPDAVPGSDDETDAVPGSDDVHFFTVPPVTLSIRVSPAFSLAEERLMAVPVAAVDHSPGLPVET